MDTCAEGLDHLTEDLERGIKDSLTLNNFVDVARSGMVSATNAVDWISVNRKVAEALKEEDPYGNEKVFKTHQERAKKLEDFAREEATRGFPYLYSIAIVRMWGILEAAVDDLVRRRFRTADSLPSSGVLGKIEGTW